jgi:4-diphosphocytidyl-2-C-methyl-D-erythritol kinase
MKSIKLLSPAKVNLFLEVFGKRDDGYHEIATVIHPVDLCDQIYVIKKMEGIKITTSPYNIPEKKNIAYKIASLIFRRFHLKKGVFIHIRKRIPIGAGLGGGSSNAGSVALAINKIFGLKLSYQELFEIAKELGSDVPFFLDCVTSLCTGRGEIVTPINYHKSFYFMIFWPGFSISTKEVYSNPQIDLTTKRRDVIRFIKALSENDIKDALFNRLERSVFFVSPRLKGLKYKIERLMHHKTLVSGAGSSLFCLFEEKEKALLAAKTVSQIKDLKTFVVASFKEEDLRWRLLM